MIRLLLLFIILFGTMYLIRWFLKTPAETVASTIRKSLWLALGLGLIFLAVMGKLNIIFAFIGSAIPVIARHTPNILRLLGLAKSIKSAHANQAPHSKPPNPQQMSPQQALDILGLEADPSKKQIIDAHKHLMQKLHPDKGGTEHLAMQLNQAKALLLKHYDY